MRNNSILKREREYTLKSQEVNNTTLVRLPREGSEVETSSRR